MDRAGAAVTVTGEHIAHFMRAVEAHLGIRLGDRESTVPDLIARRAASHREPTGAYLERVEAADPDELRALAIEISVGETYFFRHVEQFHVYAHLLPELAATRGHVRVLSAGCSTGEEPYTLAMVARERLVDPRAVTIRGIDFNQHALARARRARYTRWVLRATPPDVERRWFTPDGRELVLAQAIRDAVSFGEANLNDDAGLPPQPPWDIIFCRNVLMYLGEAALAAAVERLVRALVPGGFLFLGHAETLRAPPADLELCHTHGTFYYRRTGRALPAVLAVPVAAAAARSTPDRGWIGDIAAAAERVRSLVDTALARAPTPPPLDAIRRLICEERFAEAREALTRVPASEAGLLRAIVAAQTGDAAAALRICGELLAAGHDRASAHYVMSICDPDARAAEQHARESLASDPAFAMACVQLAFLARRRRDRAESVERFRRAIGLLEAEDAGRLALFSGGFSRAALVDLCRTELAAAGAT